MLIIKLHLKIKHKSKIQDQQKLLKIKCLERREQVNRFQRQMKRKIRRIYKIEIHVDGVASDVYPSSHQSQNRWSIVYFAHDFRPEAISFQHLDSSFKSWFFLLNFGVDNSHDVSG